LLAVMSFIDKTVVVRQANVSIYGLQAGVWTADLNKTHSVARALRAGTVDADTQSSPLSIVFHPASGIDGTAVAQAQDTLRRRILRAFVGRGLLESFEAQEVLAYQHSGFSVDAGVCIQAHDRAMSRTQLQV
jgi:Aldehyde dehydrogenase family/Putative transposase